jgi:hypothetical protein
MKPCHDQEHQSRNGIQLALRLPGNRAVTLTFAGTDSAALSAAKDILVQYSIQGLLEKGTV